MRSEAYGRRAVLRGLLALATPAAAASALQVGKPAPSATLMALDGKRVSTRELLGQVIILTFWATWCVPCREELPLLSAYASEHASQGLRVLGFRLDTPDQITAVRAVAATLSFPVGLLGSDRLAGYGRIWRIPVNFTIDRNGHLVDNGWKDIAPVWTRQRLARIVSPLLDS